jgi:hypothetical protein
MKPPCPSCGTTIQQIRADGRCVACGKLLPTELRGAPELAPKGLPKIESIDDLARYFGCPPVVEDSSPRPRPYEDWRTDPYGRWLDAFHTFGHLLMTHARDDALRQIPATASAETREVAAKAAVDALYNVMMILEGVVGAPGGRDRVLEFALIARLREIEKDQIVEEIEIAPNGEETVCMGFHFWTDGDFLT